MPLVKGMVDAFTIQGLKVFGPTQAAAQLEPQLRLAKVDTEAVPALGARFQIRSIPTLAIFKGGREVARVSGARSAAELVQWINSHTH